MKTNPDRVTNQKLGFTLVEIMITVAIIGMLAVMAIPSYVRSRTASQTSVCLNNLRQIDGAKAQYAIDSRLGTGDEVLGPELNDYLKNDWPIEEPSSGDYTANDIGSPPDCSIGGKHIIN